MLSFSLLKAAIRAAVLGDFIDIGGESFAVFVKFPDIRCNLRFGVVFF
jgi:hypothetical protein